MNKNNQYEVLSIISLIVKKIESDFDISVTSDSILSLLSLVLNLNDFDLEDGYDYFSDKYFFELRSIGVSVAKINKSLEDSDFIND